MLLCTSPYCNYETAAILEFMIHVHHACFVKLFPKTPITPKMHFMLHLPRQMTMFGPLRASWCMRFEAKHSCFKSKKWRNFKNLPLSISMLHQKLMCSRQTSGFGLPNENFLYTGDDVKIRTKGVFSQMYPNLQGSFSQLYSVEPNVPEPTVYFAKEVKIHGHKYRPGCALIMGYNDDDIPQLATLTDIVVCNDIKYFIVEIMEVTGYDGHFMSYVLQSSHEHRVLRHSDMFSVWPQSLYHTDNKLCCVNQYSHTCEFP